MIKSIVRKVVAGAVAAALCISFVFAIKYEDGVIPDETLAAIMNTENFIYAVPNVSPGSYSSSTYFVGALSSEYNYDYIYGRHGKMIYEVRNGDSIKMYIPLFIENPSTTLTLDIAYYLDFTFRFNVNTSKLVFADDGSSTRTPVEITNERNVTFLESNAGNSFAPLTTVNTATVMQGGSSNFPAGRNNAFTVTVSGEIDFLEIDFTFNGNYNAGSTIYGVWGLALLGGSATIPPPKTIDDVIAELHIIQDKLDAIIEELQDQQAGMAGTIQQIVENQQIIIEDTAEDEAQFALIQQQQQAVEDRIDELEEKMELVQPVDPDDLHLSGDQVLSTDYDVQSFSDVFGSFLENQFILQMMMTVLGLGLLSYIFFGKKT